MLIEELKVCVDRKMCYQDEVIDWVESVYSQDVLRGCGHTDSRLFRHRLSIRRKRPQEGGGVQVFDVEDERCVYWTMI